jgi:hypothetical protein
MLCTGSNSLFQSLRKRCTQGNLAYSLLSLMWGESILDYEYLRQFDAKVAINFISKISTGIKGDLSGNNFSLHRVIMN